jgi:hypothetical protein
MEAIVKEQILAVRYTGLTNMFDANAVQRIANDMGFFDLVCYIVDNKKEYTHFILYGD